MQSFLRQKTFKLAVHDYIGLQVASSSEAHELSKLFQSMDANNDGLLSQKEVEDAYRSYGKPLSQDELNLLFKKMDKDGSGKISWNEFLVASQNYDIAAKENNFNKKYENCIKISDHSNNKSRMMQVIKNSLLSKTHELGDRIDLFEQ